ncbi:uncharacterized protein LOC110429769 [Sorghum bicolor]|uniref:uncharacterized protein LOC110429769 n=1 Tax=Sorghum bicolor TaxID=4558 RepID=UPI000B423E73|nr:uncharacterized protein LOC110429769 [Sorghum bicolor]|eukprot:XP_021301967.1 uncharacterized protein LOC110429769 [Sorghum bicolor]
MLGGRMLILARSCAIHYVEEHTRRRERTRTYDLWAWCVDPCEIPLRVWLTIADPDAEQPPVDIQLPLVQVHQEEPTGVKHGLKYEVFPHVAVVEDLTFLGEDGGQGGPPNRRPRRHFIWRYGQPDSQGEVHGRRGEDRGREEHRRRDDEDDNQGGRHRRHRSASAWGRVTRCRNGAADCYSTNIRAFNPRYGGSYRSRSLKWEIKKAKVNAKVTPAPTVQSKTKKRVSFADPVASVLGEFPKVACENIKSPFVLQPPIIQSATCCLLADTMLDEFMLCATHAAAGEKHMSPNNIRAVEIRKEGEQNKVPEKNLTIQFRLILVK